MLFENKTKLEKIAYKLIDLLNKLAQEEDDKPEPIPLRRSIIYGTKNLLEPEKPPELARAIGGFIQSHMRRFPSPLRESIPLEIEDEHKKSPAGSSAEPPPQPDMPLITPQRVKDRDIPYIVGQFAYKYGFSPTSQGLVYEHTREDEGGTFFTRKVPNDEIANIYWAWVNAIRNNYPELLDEKFLRDLSKRGISPTELIAALVVTHLVGRRDKARELLDEIYYRREIFNKYDLEQFFRDQVVPPSQYLFENHPAHPSKTSNPLSTLSNPFKTPPERLFDQLSPSKFSPPQQNKR
jgi:hypothetical protein